jgi:hypothetical protein
LHSVAAHVVGYTLHAFRSARRVGRAAGEAELIQNLEYVVVYVRKDHLHYAVHGAHIVARRPAGKLDHVHQALRDMVALGGGHFCVRGKMVGFL